MAEKKVTSQTIELARMAVAAVDAGMTDVGVAVIATIGGKTQFSYDGYTPEMAQHLTARFQHWQLARLAKADLLNEARVNDELVGNATVENAKLEIVK